jgi:tetratricopeptide (TPR) repeat protein
MIRSFILYFFILFISFSVNAQIQKIDSLKFVILQLKHNSNFLKDTNYLIKTNEIAALFNSVNPDSTIAIANQNIENCKIAKYNKGLAEAMRILAMGLVSKGYFNEAIKLYEEALLIAKKVNAEKVTSKIYNGLGIIYKNLGDYKKALDYHFKSLEIKERLGDKKAIANSLGNIAIIYKNIGDYKFSLENYQKSLQIFHALNDRLGVASTLNNIASIYILQDNFNESILINEKALKIQNELGDNLGKAFSLENIGIAKTNLKLYEEAKTYLERSLAIKKVIGDENGISETLRNLSVVYKELNQFEKSLLFLSNSLKKAKSLGNKLQIANCYNDLYDYYKIINKNDLALSALENRISYDDSLQSIEIQKQIIQLKSKFEYESKERILKHEQAKRELYNQEKLNFHKQVIGLIFLVLVIVFVAIFFISKSRKKLQVAYNELEKAKLEIEILNIGLNEKVKERTLTLEETNRKLKNHLFTINHVVRKPVANILGIIKLFNFEDINDPVNETSMDLLKQTTLELDKVIHEINKNLES